MATLSEIAAQAGVSEATVSRVLNDKAGVSAATKQAVTTALDVLGYERPPACGADPPGLVGLVVPELENPIFPAFAQVIEDALAARRYTPVLCSQSAGGISEDEYVSSLLDHGVAGIIFVSGRHADATADHDRYHSLVERGLPVVFVNGYLEGLAAPFVSADDREGVELALNHLAVRAPTIGLAVGPSRYIPASRKREAFVAGYAATSTSPCRGQLDRGALYTIEGGAAAARRLVAPTPQRSCVPRT